MEKESDTVFGVMAKGSVFEKFKALNAQRSDRLEEIISTRPGMLITFANLFFLLILGGMIGLSWLIKYPDTVVAASKLTCINAPKAVISQIDAKLIKLKISENELVIKGSVIAFLESTADHNDVLKLSTCLDSVQICLDQKKPDLIQKHLPTSINRLGELQSAYQILIQSKLLFSSYMSDGFYLKNKLMLMKEKNILTDQNRNLIEQKMLQELDLNLVQKTFDANKSLRRDNVISDFDYRNEQSKLIIKRLTIPQLKTAILSNESQQAEKQREINELENTIIQQVFVFQQAFNTFRSELDDWKRKYLLVSPISGKIAFASLVEENQQLHSNQTICYVVPENREYYAEITIPQSNFGKVRVGQKVLLKFPSYPFGEFGSVIGKLDFISHIPTDSGYRAKVVFLNGLTTTHNEPIQYRNGLKANAEIVTRDSRLIDRFYYSLVGQTH